MPGLIKYSIARSSVPDPAGNPALGYRLVVTCNDFVGGPDDAVFCFKRVSSAQALFSHVASYPDMEEFGTEVPIEGVDTVFFRSNVADLVFRSPELREETAALILQDFEILTAGLDLTAVTSSVETGVIPGDPPPPSGAFTGTGVDTYSISFPAALAATPKVYVSATPAVSFKVTPSAVGFVLVAERALTAGDLIEWRVG